MTASTPAPVPGSVRERIDNASMSPFQWTVVALCVLLNMLDGFDVMAMAFTAKNVGAEFGLSGTEIGLMLSAGLVGMAAGSLFIAPLADTLGRRTVVLACVAISGIGMVGSALAPSAVFLGITRIVTGLGVGGILACTNVIASEFSNAVRRGLAIGIYTAGYGVGATVGGLAAVSLQESYGWRGVYWTGAALTLLALGVLFAMLPESIDLMILRARPADLSRINTTLAKMHQPPLASLEEAAADARAGRVCERKHAGTLLTPALRRSTLLIWLAFFATMFGFYFVNSWAPTLFANAGLSSDQAAAAGMALAIGGAVGSVLYGLVTGRGNQRSMLIVFTVVAAVAMVAMVSTTAILALTLFIGVAVGALVNGCVAGLYTVTPALYSAQIRSTGMGWGIGIGRIGAILAPLITGQLVDAGWSATQLYVGAAGLLLISAVAVVLLPRTNKFKVAAQAQPTPSR